MPHLFRNIGYLGLAVVGMSCLLLLVYPSDAPYLPNGFFTPILAFEFIETPQEVQQLFGQPLSAERERMIRKMDWGNQLDFLYMLLYSSFLGWVSVASARKTETPFVYAGGILAVIVLLGDLLENVQLFGITAKLDSGMFERELSSLRWFTWQKWGGIALIFLLLALALRKGDLLARFTAIVSIFPCIFGLLAFLHRSALNELFAISVAAMFLLLILNCFSAQNKQ